MIIPVLTVLAFIFAVLGATGRAPLYISVLLLSLIHLVAIFPVMGLR